MSTRTFLRRGLSSIALLSLMAACSDRSESSPSSSVQTKKQLSQNGGLVLEVEIDGHPLRLSLSKKSAPLGKSYQSYQPDGQGGFTKVTKKAPDCFYEGQVYDAKTNALLPDAFVGASTCIHPDSYPEGSLYGLIFVHGKHWSIAPKKGDSDLSDGVDHELTATAPLRFGEPSPAKDVVVRSSSVLMPQVARYLEGTEFETKYIELFIGNDERRLELFGGDVDAMEQDTLALIADTNLVFTHSGLEPRLRVALLGQMSVPNEGLRITPIGNETSSEDLLSSFNVWSMENMPRHDEHILLSGHDFDEGTIGLANFTGICAGEVSGGIIQTTQLNTSIAQVIAHEMGHNLWMPHDGSEDNCSPTGNIMAAYAEPGGLETPEFSECSKGYYSEMVATLAPGCLDNLPDDDNLAADQCGDAIVSGEEECDCGFDDCSEVDPCCDGATCKLTVGALCSDLNDSCCESCQPAGKDKECRPARSACDSAEFCNGQSTTCPGDRFSDAGGACDLDGIEEQGVCFQGRCMSEDEQCQRIGKQYDIEGVRGPGGECGLQVGGCAAPLCIIPGYGCTQLDGIGVENGISCSDAGQCVDGECVSSANIDQCPLDADKQNPGECGCGIADADSDSDGTLDCNDLCPNDALKTEPGICGCGAEDVDSDQDGSLNCEELCPYDPQKTESGTCGCGKPEPNATGITSCTDTCPTSIEKEAPGVCGCLQPDTDQDADGTPDCVDTCPANPSLLATPENGCIAPATGGSSGAGVGAGTGSTPGAPGSETAAKKEKKGCGCRIEDHKSPSHPAGWGLLLGLAGVLTTRRRRSARLNQGRA